MEGVILLPLGHMSFVEALWPPMEQRRGADGVWLRLERDTALRLRLLHVLDRGAMTVDQRRIGERPQSPGGAQPAAVLGNRAGGSGGRRGPARVSVGWCAQSA